ncbi:MAG: ATP-binding protein [Rhodomicrobiaceae bacterium]
MFTVILAVCVFLIINLATFNVVDHSHSAHLHAHLWMTALTAAVTTAPFAVYCMNLVRRLQNTKRDLRQAVEIAQSANTAKSAFIANLSHEIRTPLNGVLGMADALSQYPLPPDQADYVKTIRESGETLMTVLNDVLDMSKIEAGRLEIEPTEADLHQVFHSLQKLFRPGAEAKNIDLSLFIAENVPGKMRFDRNRVRQGVANLISNAVKFTHSGGVTVSVFCSPMPDGRQMVTVKVADTGIGMTADVLERLFGDFVQAETSTSRIYGGTGLGIAITRRLAQLMDGDVSVESEAGKGAVFTFGFAAETVALPATPSMKPADRRPAAARQDNIPLAGARILLVDDNAVNRKVIRMLLKPGQMEITDAENGREALEELARTHYDMVLLDIHMPVMNGIETIRHIRASPAPWRDVPVIALTADVMGYTRERLLGLGMSGYTVKPVDQRALVDEMCRAMKLSTVEDPVLTLVAQ